MYVGLDMAWRDHILQRKIGWFDALFFCIIWSIWKQRNNIIWSDKVDAEANVVDRAKHMLDEWWATLMVHNSVNATIIHVGRAKRLKP